MSAATKRALWYGNGELGAAANYNGNFAIDAATDKAAIGFIASESFTLAKVDLYVHNEVGTSPAYDIRIETDDGAGRPSGTLAWANATATFTATTAGWIGLQTLTASGAIAPGTLYHIVIQPNGVPDAINHIAIKDAPGPISPTAGPQNIYSVSERYTGSWSNPGFGIFVLSNSDSSVMIGQPYYVEMSTLTVTNTAWKGVKFTAPCNMTVWGCVFYCLNSTSAGIVSAKLISSGNSVLGTADLPAAAMDLATARGFSSRILVFSSPISLTAGETYRLVLKDTAGNQRIEGGATSSAYKTLGGVGGDAHLTEGTSSDGTASPTVWTDTDTSFPGFLLMASESPAGGGNTICVPTIHTQIVGAKAAAVGY